MNFDYTDFYIRYKNHPNFNDLDLIEDNLIKVIIQKYENILFTKKGEVFGNPNLGCDLEHYVFETSVSEDTIINIIEEQISLYVPEMLSTDYNIEIAFTKDPNITFDIMFIKTIINEYEIYAQIGNFN